MNLRQLRYFVQVAETLNFRRAAERLHISQPPLTVAIRRLEDELGTRIFERGNGPVRLTAAGLAALPFAQAALANIEGLREAIDLGSRGEVGRLSVGFVGSAIVDFLPRLIPEFRQRFPKVDLDLQEMTSAAAVQALEARQLDIGIIRLPAVGRARVSVKVVDQDVLHAAVHSSHRLANRQSVNLSDLADEPFILNSPVSILHSVVLFACQQAGFKPKVEQEATQLQTVLSLVQSRLGVALVPSRLSRLAPVAVTLLPLTEPVPTDLGIIWRDDGVALVDNFVATAEAVSDSQNAIED